MTEVVDLDRDVHKWFNYLLHNKIRLVIFKEKPTNK